MSRLVKCDYIVVYIKILLLLGDPEFCEAQSVGLVRYPATLAPDSGSTTVTAECADNARRVSSSLSVTCSSTGSWSGSPRCQCNSGYEAVTVNEKQICQG